MNVEIMQWDRRVLVYYGQNRSYQTLYKLKITGN
jgi:hypothetical protein